MSPTWTRRGRHIHGSQDASALLCQDYDQSGHRGDDHQQFQIALWFVCNILQHFATWASLVSLPHPDAPWQPGEHLLEDPFDSVVTRAWSWRPCSSIWSLWGQITWSFALQHVTTIVFESQRADHISSCKWNWACPWDCRGHSRCNCRHEWFRNSNPLTCATAQRGEWNLLTSANYFQDLPDSRILQDPPLFMVSHVCLTSQGLLHLYVWERKGTI